MKLVTSIRKAGNKRKTYTYSHALLDHQTHLDPIYAVDSTAPCRRMALSPSWKDPRMETTFLNPNSKIMLN